ncbi:hypothetical protein CEXT_463031 [Caerostris extrusa]|uniref:Uncharacterized protein n=1 Tax=Caerostris extrusa TaxID=172846 RepID=A0AAV4T247_CAEEX|nr:hypothetical protein CEXT_463031 [Caerostris extrusa]
MNYRLYFKHCLSRTIPPLVKVYHTKINGSYTLPFTMLSATDSTIAFPNDKYLCHKCFSTKRVMLRWEQMLPSLMFRGRDGNLKYTSLETIGSCIVP